MKKENVQIKCFDSTGPGLKPNQHHQKGEFIPLLLHSTRKESLQR